MKIRKGIFIFIISILFQAPCAFSQDTTSITRTVGPEILHVDRIKRSRNVFIIYVSNNNSKYMVVSPKGERPKKSIKIKEGREYELILNSFFDKKDKSRFRVTAVEINKNLIPLEGDYNFNVYLTNNLIGLFYLPPE